MISTAIFGTLSGLALGLTGGGSSIVAVPMLLFGNHLSMHEAIVVSLYAVFVTALAGALYQMARGKVHYKSAGMMILGGTIGSPIGALINRHLPQSILILLFTLLMLYTGVRLWRKAIKQGQQEATQSSSEPSLLILCLAGLSTGVLTGLLGVGGGFLIVPALLFAARLQMPNAIATSLLVISGTALTSIIAHHQGNTNLPLPMILSFAMGSLVGMGVGTSLAKHLSPLFLQKLFSAFMMSIGVLMLAQQVI